MELVDGYRHGVGSSCTGDGTATEAALGFLDLYSKKVPKRWRMSFKRVS